MKDMPVLDLVSEDEASELATAANMEPYIRLALARLEGTDLSPGVRDIADLPVEKRYVWKVASTLKEGFGDFDSANVAVDRVTLSREDLAQVVELLSQHPIQFCWFMKALVGSEEMERLMVQGVNGAKQKEALNPDAKGLEVNLVENVGTLPVTNEATDVVKPARPKPPAQHDDNAWRKYRDDSQRWRQRDHGHE